MATAPRITVAPTFGSGDMKERALDLAATARERVTGGASGLRAYIVKEPTRALGIALVLGVIVGWLIKRR